MWLTISGRMSRLSPHLPRSLVSDVMENGWMPSAPTNSKPTLLLSATTMSIKWIAATLPTVTLVLTKLVS